ncbi:MAG: DUF3846 domain-containing protein [Microbacteriaceae bacterium]
MARAFIIPADTDRPIVDRRCEQLEDWQAAVGGLIEHVATVSDAALFVNEEHRLLGLPFNLRASVLAEQLDAGVGPLHGDVAVFGAVDMDGDERDIPAWLVERLTDAHSVVQVVRENRSADGSCQEVYSDGSFGPIVARPERR